MARSRSLPCWAFAASWCTALWISTYRSLRTQCCSTFYALWLRWSRASAIIAGIGITILHVKKPRRRRESFDCLLLLSPRRGYCLKHRLGLVHALLIFRRRIGVGDNTGSRLKISLLALHEHGANCDT